MTNADKFKAVFGMYSEEFWAKPEQDMLSWINSEYQEPKSKVTVQSVNWIPVTERLPEERINPNTRDFEYVLCVTIWGDVRPFKYGTPIGQKEAHFWNGAGYVDAYVTHWMPLPKPPKGDNP